jgi:toxin ParE1/3/4
LDDLKAQVAYIAAENPGAAQRVADRIGATCKALGEMATGRPGRVSGTYEKSVPRLPTSSPIRSLGRAVARSSPSCA